MTDEARVRHSGRWLRLRQHASDKRWPMWLRVLMARPHAYGFARQAWRWSRCHALGYALAPLFGRTYTHAVVSRIPDELLPDKPRGGFYG